MTVQQRPVDHVDGFPVGQMEVVHRSGEIGLDRAALEGGAIIQENLQIDHSAHVVLQQPLRIGPIRPVAPPQYPGCNHAEIADRGIEAIGAGTFGRVLCELHTPRQHHQQHVHQHKAGCVLYLERDHLTPHADVKSGGACSKCDAEPSVERGSVSLRWH
jgi:hypothetical protein